MLSVVPLIRWSMSRTIGIRDAPPVTRTAFTWAQPVCFEFASFDLELVRSQELLGGLASLLNELVSQRLRSLRELTPNDFRRPAC